MVITDPNLKAAITKWDTYLEGGAHLHNHTPLSFLPLCPQPAYSNTYVYVCNPSYVCPLVPPVIRVCPQPAYSHVYVYVRDPIYVCPLVHACDPCMSTCL